MTKVSVFLFEVPGKVEGVQVQPNKMATRETIELFNGRIVPGSGKEVDAENVDTEGYYLLNHD